MGFACGSGRRGRDEQDIISVGRTCRKRHELAEGEAMNINGTEVTVECPRWSENVHLQIGWQGFEILPGRARQFMARMLFSAMQKLKDGRVKWRVREGHDVQLWIGEQGFSLAHTTPKRWTAKMLRRAMRNITT